MPNLNSPAWRLRLVTSIPLLRPVRTQSMVIVGSDFGDSEFVPITTLNEASARYRAFIIANNLGASQAGQCLIYSENQVVAHVSYNGRVWEGEHWHPGQVELFNPNSP